MMILLKTWVLPGENKLSVDTRKLVLLLLAKTTLHSNRKSDQQNEITTESHVSKNETFQYTKPWKTFPGIVKGEIR